MVKNKNDKSKISNWEEGDVFALKIKSEIYPTFNNQYIIFIHTKVDNENWNMSRTTNLFRAKITVNYELPTTAKEIEKLEYIKTSADGFLLEKEKNSNEIKKVTPDKYNFIYKYLFKINSIKFKIPRELIYIGNFNLEKPINEYIPDSPFNKVLLCFWQNKYSNVIDDILKKYKLINLKESEYFTEKGQKEFLEKQQQDIFIWKDIKQLQKDLEGSNGEKILNSMGIDIEKEKKVHDFDTYVGK